MRKNKTILFGAVAIALLAVAAVSISGCKKEHKSLTSCFNPSVTETVTGQLITFTSCSLDATSYTWDFGDGVQGQGAVVTHQYSTNGTYTVTLTASGSGGTETSTKQIIIGPLTQACINVSYPGYAGYEVSFKNCTNRASSYSWNFGDGATSVLDTPKHTYTSAGTYTIKLTANSLGGSYESTDSVTITILAGSPESHLAGIYNIFDMCTTGNWSYDLTITAIGTDVIFSNLNQKGPGFQVHGSMTSSNLVTIPNQTIHYGNDDYTVSGGGTFYITPDRLSFNYYLTDMFGTNHCSFYGNKQ